MLNRRAFVGQAAALGLARGMYAAAPRPNILWISCEDAGTQFGCYGDRYAVTPVIDKLASEGVRYSHAHAVAGVCAPSRSGIITGMYPTSLGSQYMRCQVTLPDHVKCFPEYLRNVGYYCTNNSKTDYNFPVPPNAWDESSARAHWNKRAKDQPFFAVFNITTTHESQVRKRGPDFEQMIRRVKPAHRRDPAKGVLPPYYPDTPEARRDWANYYELITDMDHETGERLREIETAGLLDNTIVFFWGDHGVGLPRAKRWLYESSTQVPLVVRIPEKLRARGQGSPGSVDAQLVSLIDLGPTVLNLCGVTVPDHMDGRAFLGDNLTKPRQYVFAARDRMDERYDSVRMVRDQRYRYLRNYEPHKPYAQHTAYMEQGNIMKDLRRLAAQGRLPEGAKHYMADHKPVEELYDVEADPHEMQNLADVPQHRRTLERMRAAHQRWQLETRDVGLIPEPEVEERGRRLGSRYGILRQPGSEKYLRELRELVDAVNRDSDVRMIEKTSTHPDAVFRYWSVVGQTKTEAAASKASERVLAAMKDDTPVVRIAAARGAALHLDNSEAIQLLIAELASANPYVRLHAALALDDLGKRAAPAREALERLAARKEEYTTRVADHALAALAAEH